MTFSLPRPRLSWFLSSLFLAVVLCASIIVLLTRTNQVGGWQALVVRSGSMTPAIPTGSVVLVQRQSQYGPNDVITFQSGAQLVTHRVVDKKIENWQGQYVTKGDANDSIDKNPVAYSDISGKVVVSIPWLGYFFTFLQTPLGVTLLVVIPGTILLYEHLKRIREMWNQRRVVIVGVVVVLCLGLPVGQTLAAYATTAHVQGMLLKTTRWIFPVAIFSQEQDVLTVALSQAGGIDRIEYQVEYSHVVDGESINEKLIGEQKKELAQEDFTLPDLIIGTCSSDVCVAHQEVKSMKITLRYFSGDELVLESSEPFEFQE